MVNLKKMLFDDDNDDDIDDVWIKKLSIMLIGFHWKKCILSVLSPFKMCDHVWKKIFHMWTLMRDWHKKNELDWLGLEDRSKYFFLHAWYGDGDQQKSILMQKKNISTMKPKMTNNGLK